jgi:acetyltransferase-like isoleucine patch superfamily enzyme
MLCIVRRSRRTREGLLDRPGAFLSRQGQVMSSPRWFKWTFGTYSYLGNLGNHFLDLLPAFIRDLLFSRLFGEYGNGVYIDYGCYFRYFRRIKFGNSITINRGCRFFASHYFREVEIRIGDHVAISPEVCFFAAGHDHESLELPDIAKSIVVGNHAWIGGRCIILPGVTVGEGAVVGAGSVVSKDIPPWTVAVGNPARVIKERVVARERLAV